MRLNALAWLGMTVVDSTPREVPARGRLCVRGAAHPRPDGQDRYTISEVAAYTGLSAPTLRWYEQIGLMPDVERSHTGQRVFGNRDLDRLAFVSRLRLTGMPIPGTRKRSRLLESAAATRITLSAEELALLEPIA
ncbi:hypothetical protein GCM10020000_21250 [Streptomyces olivoverticillatus]